MVTLDPEGVAPVVGVSPPATASPEFISCCPEELVEVELEGLRQGRERARADGAQALRGMQAITEAANAVCDRMLRERYVALDEAKFRDVFTLAWCAGYHEATTQAPRG